MESLRHRGPNHLCDRKSAHGIHGTTGAISHHRGGRTTRITAGRRLHGVELDDLWDDIVSEWEQAGNMKASWLPRSFREGRAMFTLEFPTGWWIDITATETITALHDLFENSWPTSSGAVEKTLTVSDLTGEDRILTTAIAEMLRENVTLDDGTLPLGVEFMSKHGHPTGSTGRCWAYWMRGPDSGLAETAQVTNITPILHDDSIFLAALKHCKIKAR